MCMSMIIAPYCADGWIWSAEGCNMDLMSAVDNLYHTLDGSSYAPTVHGLQEVGGDVRARCLVVLPW